jgi:hypothetical protein
MPNLNSVQREVREIIKYGWAKEGEDYAKMLSSGENVEDHVFVCMMTVSNVLDGMKTDLNRWILYNYGRFFDDMKECDMCPGCDEGTLELVKASGTYPAHLECSNCGGLCNIEKEGE